MLLPQHRDDDGAPPAKGSPSVRTKLLVGAVAVLLAVFVALHVAGVFGP
jgi:hypothetical protein